MHLTIFISDGFKYYIILICSKPKLNKRLEQHVTKFLPQPVTEFLLYDFQKQHGRMSVMILASTNQEVHRC
jgi:hypothetical protein